MSIFKRAKYKKPPDGDATNNAETNNDSLCVIITNRNTTKNPTPVAQAEANSNQHAQEIIVNTNNNNNNNKAYTNTTNNQNIVRQQEYPSISHRLTNRNLVQLGSTFHQLGKHPTNTNGNFNSDFIKLPTTTNSDNNNQHQAKKNIEKICMGTSNRISGQQNKTDHYQSLVDRYRNCTYVSGNLELTWLHQGADLSFLESIREVTGYLLIAYVEVEKISMPNLQIIRGRDLFRVKQEQGYALILIDNGIKSLELPNLREILEGSFGSTNNRNLCHIDTINWDEILNRETYKPVISYNNATPECPPCDLACDGMCWGEGADMCQKFSKVNCSPQCSQGRCFGSLPRECCHIHCAGGCTGPKQTDCLACKYFDNDGECIKECPSMTFYDPIKFSVEPNPNGRYAYGSSCVKECPAHLLRDREACVKSCPLNKRNINGECVPCVGPCPKNCQGVEVVHSGNIDQLINCTEIEGSITILDTSFTGYKEYNDSFGAYHEPMHPSRLKVFETVHTITGYLDIQANHSDFKDLSCFKNLEVIGGRSAAELFYTLRIIKTSLVSLNMHKLRKVNTGRFIVEENTDLCFVDTINWDFLNLTRRDEIITRNNADPRRCRKLGLQCHEQCTRDGCWGPGLDQCLSCNNYKLDNYCVDNCKSFYLPLSRSPVLAFEAGNRTCKRCHQECSGGCTGTEARDCWQCKRVKDGPYCVSECPSHKYNNNGICEDCDKSCVDGCTGPSNRFGQGGCNSCAKFITTNTQSTPTTNTKLFNLSNHGLVERALSQANCTRQEDPCPVGFYQEYLIGVTAEGWPKSSYGKPVCSRCHHRCKSCTGMGAHVSVCECAKYVAGESCEDHCPGDYFADEQHRRCVKCSPECNNCTGPTEADCITCRKYRIYHDVSSVSSNPAMLITHEDQSSSSSSLATTTGGPSNQIGKKFNCTAHCPLEKPHLVSGSDLLDPYCSKERVPELENLRREPIISSPTHMMILLFVSIIACFVVYWRLAQQKNDTVKLSMALTGVDDSEPLTPSNVKPNLSTMQSIKETELRIGRLLGEGFGGKVFMGFWHPENPEHSKNNGKPVPVAIKVLRDNGQSNVNKDFLNEAYMMASLDHPNLVSLMAICNSSKNLMLITPLMPFGCLLEYVRLHKNIISSKNLLEWCKQIAKGMAHLEEKGVVHRDLALRNVLLQTPSKALISDFGLAKLLDLGQSEYQSVGGRLPIKWLAPECFQERVFTHKSDVWAFGVTVWELLTFGAKPFEEYESIDVPQAIINGARLQQPKHVTAEIYKVMLSCWFFEPQNRPDIKNLAETFVNFARDPERYLSLSSKGIDFKSTRSLGRNSDSDIDGAGYDEHSDINNMMMSMDMNSMNGFGGATNTHEPLIGGLDQIPQPRSATFSHLAATATTAPSTPSHRINGVFDFKTQRFQSESSEATAHVGLSSNCLNALPSTPTSKKMFQSTTCNMMNGHLIDQEIFTHSNTPNSMSGNNHNFTRIPSTPTSTSANGFSRTTTDANNNNFTQFTTHDGPRNTQANQLAESCSSVYNTVSSNSLGQKSEQPVDDQDYLLPSPFSNDTKFSKFLNSHPSSTLPPAPSNFSTRDPPHSAGLIGICNQEYFLTRMNYVKSNRSHHNHHHHGGAQNASSGHIPTSLV